MSTKETLSYIMALMDKDAPSSAINDLAKKYESEFHDEFVNLDDAIERLNNAFKSRELTFNVEISISEKDNSRK